jgi:hypothetical protein
MLHSARILENHPIRLFVFLHFCAVGLLQRRNLTNQADNQGAGALVQPVDGRDYAR